MATYEVAPEIVAFYAKSHDEANRLSATPDGRLEMVRTQELLRRHLPPAPATVLDVGGGRAAHARWLAADGYHVHLVDPVQRHLDEARAVGCTVELGDARSLTADDASYDVALLLGPLYHLRDRHERLSALTEARRVLRPGGLLAVAAINRYAPLLEQAATATLADERVRTAVATVLTTGWHDGKRGFTASYFHTATELADELADADFAEPAARGIEGPAWALLKATQHSVGSFPLDSSLLAAAVEAARLAEPYPELLAAGSHLLATARRQPGRYEGGQHT